MKRVLTLALAAIAAMLVPLSLPTARASSHREAPLISQDPEADNTDLYAFVSPDRPDTVTIIANYIPLEEPAGGPNFNTFADDVLYAINVDNDGDGEEDVSFRFQFRTVSSNPDTSLYNTGPITSLDDPDSPDVSDSTPMVDDVLAEREEAERLRAAVLQLPEDLRFTVTAHFWGGLAVKEIAELEEITTVGIRKRLHKAFSILETILHEEVR